MKEYDYAQPGGYFITIVTSRRNCLFGEIVTKKMQWSDYGSIADERWCTILDHFPIGSIPTMTRTYKSAVTRRIGRELNAKGIWQRNYYEHVIRNREDWDRIHRYIESNPSKWAKDQEHPTRKL